MIKIYEVLKIMCLVIFAGYDEKSFEVNGAI